MSSTRARAAKKTPRKPAAKAARKAAKAAPRRAAKPRQAAVKAIPDGYHSATPYLIVKGGSAAIDFYRRAFGATELMRFADPSGKVGHAELKVGDSVIMLADEVPEMGFKSPKTLGGTGGSIMLYVKDVDAVFARAIAVGARELQPVTDKFYGDRSGMLEDPFGHQWSISTHTEDVAPQEMEARMAAFAKQQAGG
jgi:PhnB protein